MYPETTGIVRETIKRRYELIPYIYSLALESHMTASPPQRWTGWGYEHDPEVWANRKLTDGETQYWLGDSMLVGGVFEPGVSKAQVYLPSGADFINLSAPYQYLKGGQWVEIESKWDDSIPVLGKVGGVVAVGRREQVLSIGDKSNPASLPLDDYRAIELFPPQGRSGKPYQTVWFEDDGISNSQNSISDFTIVYETTDNEVLVNYKEELRGGLTPHWNTLTIVMPVGDQRNVTFNGSELQDSGMDKKGRKTFKTPYLRPRSVASRL
jgi:alpha-glucosidase (family GH31 glycosyl hydrolase)